MGRPRIGLRSQLILLCLAVLVLPIGALLYLREVEQSLLAAQRQEVDASLKSRATELLSTDLVAEKYFPPPEPDGLRFLPLSARPPLDGSCDDWQQGEVSFEDGEMAGWYSGDLYLCFLLPEAPREVRLEGDVIDLSFPFVERGSVFAIDMDSGATRYESRAAWISRVEGVLFEVQIPRFLLGNRLGLEIVGPQMVTQKLLGYRDGNPSRYYLQPAPSDSGLEAVEGESIHLWSRTGLMMAGILEAPGPARQSVPWLVFWQRLILGEPVQARLALGQKLQLPTRLLEDSESLYEYFDWQGEIYLMVASPLQLEGLELGWLTSLRPAASFNPESLVGLNRVLSGFALAFLMIATLFIGYAGWLVRRIRSLDRSVASMLRRAEPVPARISAGDELSQLDWQFTRLSDRLEGYTGYLQSLAGKLSHELRTPMAIVSSSLDNLDSAPNEQQRAVSLNRARDGLARLERTLGLMAQASSFEQLLDEVKLQPFQPCPVLSELVEAYRVRYPDHEFRLNLQTEPDCVVLGSADLMVQALDKLVDNAVDFTSGAILIDFSRQGTDYCLSVENPGPLLPQAMENNLFDALVSVRPGSSGDEPHLGFGLQMVKRIAEKFGGQAYAANLPDESGVRFGLTMCPPDREISLNS